SGDLDTKPGKLLQAYRPAGVGAKRVVLASAGDGSARRVQAAICAAVASLKSAGAKRLVIVLPANAGDAQVRAAVTGTAEASYVYVATKSKPEGRALERVTIAAGNAPVSKAAFALARAEASGIEFARELGNLPP